MLSVGELGLNCLKGMYGQEESDVYLGKINNGSIAVTEALIKQIGLSENEAFKMHLNEVLKENSINDSCAGWYAKKLQDGIWYFKWACSHYRITKRAYHLLLEDGWQMAHPEDSFSYSLYKD